MKAARVEPFALAVGRLRGGAGAHALETRRSGAQLPERLHCSHRRERERNTVQLGTRELVEDGVRAESLFSRFQILSVRQSDLRAAYVAFQRGARQV